LAREWREEYEGGIYHVIARGNNKEYFQGEYRQRVSNKSLERQYGGYELQIIWICTYG
jgi:hypothetical protein